MIIRSKAPMRISFAGGGTDIPPFPEREGGCVLSATINRYTWGTLRSRQDQQIRIESLDFGYSLSYKIKDELFYDGKLDLVKAAIRKMCSQDITGFDLFLHSDAPPGTGLGSSSTLVVALVGLMKELRHLPLTDYEIAHLAYTIERKDMGIQGGLQDQYASTFGGFNFIEFYKDRVIVNPLRINPEVINELEHNLLLCYTGTARLSDHIIEDQKGRYQKQDVNTVDGLRQQKELAIIMKNALLQRRLKDFGDLLHTAWESKKKMSPKISNPRIDEIYEEARKHGALGGKITGAGGGGFMLLYCSYERKHKVAEALNRMNASPIEYGLEFRGLQTWRVNDE